VIGAPKDGIYRGVPFAEYVAWDADNASMLKHVLASPAHYRHAKDNPEPDDPTNPNKGTLAHLALLEPAEYARRVRVWDGGARRGPDYKAFLADNPGKMIVKDADAVMVQRMAAALRSSPGIRDLACTPESCHEVSIIVTDPTCERRQKARLDILTDNAWADYKTHSKIGRGQTADGWLRSWYRASDRLGYALQFAHYSRVLRLVGLTPPGYVIIQGYSAIGECVRLPITPGYVDHGEKIRTGALATIIECEASGEWPLLLGFRDEAPVLDVPAWADDGLSELEDADELENAE